MLCTIIISAALLSRPDDAAASDDERSKLLKTFRDEFIAVTPGEGDFPKSYLMGDPADKEGASPAGPPREVTLAHSFQIAKYEVPQNLWEAVMGTNPSRWKGPRNSVEMLSWDEAGEFCQKATEQMREAKLIEEDESIRLPSEAEWEYVARAGTKTAYSFGDDASKLDDYGWHTGNASGNDPPVGAKKPNDWGLYDVHGYLWEWCEDAWSDNLKDAPADGSAVEGKKGADRVLRGGSWKDKPELLKSFHRRGADPDTRDDAVGLRCVLAKKRP
jgi:formylglycine-generating enzyme required for sulfatase activity